MGNSRNFVLILFLAASAAPLHGLFAQERSLTTTESAEGRQDQYAQRDGIVEPVATTTIESDGISQLEEGTAAGGDSTNVRVKADRPQTDASKNEDLVSFNFLYYIIQRYKMSDIVDRKAAQ